MIATLRSRLGLTTLRRNLLGGLLDSGLAALSTFAVGLYAARYLTLPQLGGYGLLFAATFMLGSGTLQQAYFTPAEVEYLRRGYPAQLASLVRSAGTGLLLGMAIGVLVVGGAALLIPDLAWPDRLALAVGAWAVSALSPTQDHLRRMLHQVERSMWASAVSFVQLFVAVGMLVGFTRAGVATVWIPLSALAAANASSLLVGLLLARWASNGAVGKAPALREASRLGRWLLLSAQVEQLGGFIGVALLGRIAGAVALGQVEAVRVLSQPIVVISNGLFSVLRPRAMHAARVVDAVAARRVDRIYVYGLAAVTVPYALVVGTEWPGSPFVRLFPNSYERNGMMLAMILVTAFVFSSSIFAVQAISARKERDLARISITNQVVLLGTVAVSAAPLGAMAWPLASALDRLVWFLRYLPLGRRIYQVPPPAPLPAPV